MKNKHIDKQPIDMPSTEELAYLISLLHDRMISAHKKHPDWPKSVLGGVAVVVSEAGELLQAVVKNESENRMGDEALDVAASAMWLTLHLYRDIASAGGVIDFGWKGKSNEALGR